MKDITTIKYKDFDIVISVSERGKFYAKCPELELQSSNPGDGDCGYST